MGLGHPVSLYTSIVSKYFELEWCTSRYFEIVSIFFRIMSVYRSLLQKRPISNRVSIFFRSEYGIWNYHLYYPYRFRILIYIISRQFELLLCTFKYATRNYHLYSPYIIRILFKQFYYASRTLLRTEWSSLFSENNSDFHYAPGDFYNLLVSLCLFSPKGWLRLIGSLK